MQLRKRSVVFYEIGVEQTQVRLGARRPCQNCVGAIIDSVAGSHEPDEIAIVGSLQKGH
jgi:hypothetical protein